jgi:hypothetical protein
MKIGLQKIANSLCQNNLKKLSWYLALRKKIIQRYRRMRLEALGAFSYGA